MPHQLCILVCSTFFPEVSHLLQSGKYADVVVKSYPATCSGPYLNAERIRHLTDEVIPHFSKTIFIGNSCFGEKSGSVDPVKGLEIIPLEQCFSLIINESLIAHFASKGCYIVSNGWLRHYQHHLDAWGFDAETAKSFFRESMSKLLCLDTGIPGEYLPQLEAVAAFMGLPYEILPVGLSHCSHFLDSIIERSRADYERLSLNKKLARASRHAADHAMFFNTINKLVVLTDESEIATQIFGLLNVFFAPANIGYTPVVKGDKGATMWLHRAPITSSADETRDFSIDVTHQGVPEGIFTVIGIAFPEYAAQYKEPAQIVGNMSGLAIANARKFAIIKENEKRLETYAAELKQSNDTKDKFVSIIAHDLRGSFGGVIGLAETLTDLSDKLAIEDIQSIAQSLAKAASNVYRLFENLLEWSRMQRGLIGYEPANTQLHALATSVVDTIAASAAQKGVSVQLEIDKDIFLHVDVRMIETVLRNLVVNAIKFTHEGGTVFVTAGASHDGMAVINVKDTGIGMNKALLGKLFRLDAQVTRQGTAGEPSTGLGLILSKEFVEKHGGKIWAESEEQVGSTISFTLPMVEEGEEVRS